MKYLTYLLILTACTDQPLLTSTDVQKDIEENKQGTIISFDF